MPTNTTNIGLIKPDAGQRNWDDEINSDLDRLDAQFGATGTSGDVTTGHVHSGVAGEGPKLDQANTHQNPDTDQGAESLHHTLGTGANQAAPGNQVYTTVQEQGTALAQRRVLNFIGDSVTITDDATNGRTDVTVQGGGHIIQSDGAPLPQRPNMNMRGFTLTDDSANDATIIQALLPTMETIWTGTTGAVTSFTTPTLNLTPFAFVLMSVRAKFSTGAGQRINVRFNGDTANNYGFSHLWGTSSIGGSHAYTAGYFEIGHFGGTDATTTADWSDSIVLLIAPGSATTRKRVTLLGGGFSWSGSSMYNTFGGYAHWRNSTNPITTITLFGASGGTLNVDSEVVLYGIRTTNPPANFGALEIMSVQIGDYASGIPVGDKATFTVPFNCTITEWTILADQVGSIVFDIERSDYASYPTMTSIIGGGVKPSLSAAQKNRAAPSGWTAVDLTAGETIRVQVETAQWVTGLSLDLTLRRR